MRGNRLDLEKRDSGNGLFITISWWARAVVLSGLALSAWILGGKEATKSAIGPTVLAGAFAFDALSFWMLAFYLRGKKEDAEHDEGQHREIPETAPGTSFISRWKAGFKTVRQVRGLRWLLIYQLVLSTLCFSNAFYFLPHLEHALGMEYWKILLICAGGGAGGALGAMRCKTSPSALWICSLSCMLFGLPMAISENVWVIGICFFAGGVAGGPVFKMFDTTIQGTADCENVKQVADLLSFGLANFLLAGLQGLVALKLVTNQWMMIGSASAGIALGLLILAFRGKDIASVMPRNGKH